MSIRAVDLWSARLAQAAATYVTEAANWNRCPNHSSSVRTPFLKRTYEDHADLPGRRSLRSARTNRLLVPSVKLSTVGGSTLSAQSLSTFRQRLKHFCSRLRSLTLSLIPGKLFPTSSGSWSDFITWTTLKIHDWLLDWRTAWMDNIKRWTGLSVEESIRMAEDGDKWKKSTSMVCGQPSDRGRLNNRTEPRPTYGPIYTVRVPYFSVLERIYRAMMN